MNPVHLQAYNVDHSGGLLNVTITRRWQHMAKNKSTSLCCLLTLWHLLNEHQRVLKFHHWVENGVGSEALLVGTSSCLAFYTRVSIPHMHIVPHKISKLRQNYQPPNLQVQRQLSSFHLFYISAITGSVLH
jgi:hypothetical protein